MKKIKLIHCLLALGILWSACDPKTADQGISLTAKEICDPTSKDKRGCLPLDDQHAVLISLQDGKPSLRSLSADSMQFGREKSFGQLRDQLLRSQQGHRFTPAGTKIVTEKDALVFTSTQRGAEFRIPNSDLQNGFAMLLNDGMEMFVTSFSNIPSVDADCSKPIDLTDKIPNSASEDCGRITVLDNICFTSLGVAEILDNAIDPLLLVRVRLDKDWLINVLKQNPSFDQNPTQWIELNAKGFHKPALAQPQAALHTAPLHFAQDVPPPGSSDGACGLIELQMSPEICRFRLGNKRIIYCDHALYSADDAAGTNKVLILTLNQKGCDLCLSKEGECIIISPTTNSTCLEGDFCASLEPCTM